MHNTEQTTMKCSAYVAMSVDGYIAGPDGDLDWLHRAEYAVENLQGLGFKEFVASVDVIVMGRHTFQKVLSITSTWPYDGTPVVVLSTSKIELAENLKGKVSVMAGSPEEIVAQLESEGKNHLYIDGGVTIQQFLNAGLINEITITCIPIILGGGISLFGPSGIEVPLRLIESAQSDNGFVQLRYGVD